jgi:hypothetical protein
MSVSRKQLKAERRQRRQVMEQTRAAVESRQSRRKYMVLGGALLALIALVAAFAALAGTGQGNQAALDPNRRPPDTTSRGFADQGNTHISQGQIGSVSYNSSPPTSGPHMPNLAPGGWHDEPVQREYIVHNLEDGYMAIQYRPNLPEEQKARLREIVDRMHNQDNRRVIAVPYEGLQAPIVLTAWTRLDELQRVDEQRIRNFADAYAYPGADYHKR